MRPPHEKSPFPLEDGEWRRNHERRIQHTSRGRAPAGRQACNARDTACSCHVWRRGRRSADRRTGAATEPGRRRLPDFGGSLRLRHRHHHPVARTDERHRHSPPRDDGRHLCRRRPHGLHGGHDTGDRRGQNDLRRDHRCRARCASARARHGAPFEVLPARCHRHDHSRHRGDPDARRRQLDIRQSLRPDRAETRGSGPCAMAGGIETARHGRRICRAGRARPRCDDTEPDLCRTEPCGACRLRSGLHSRCGALRQGSHQQHRCSDRHRGRMRSGGYARHDALRSCGERRLVRRRDAPALRHAHFRSGADCHDVARHGRGDDRIDRHVPGARRDDQS